MFLIRFRSRPGFGTIPRRRSEVQLYRWGRSFAKLPRSGGGGGACRRRRAEPTRGLLLGRAAQRVRRAGVWGQVGGCEVGWGGQVGCRCRPLVAPRAWAPQPGVSPRGDECCWEAEGCLAASPVVTASMCAGACLSEAPAGRPTPDPSSFRQRG